jgi:hypothetical protein
MHHPKKTNRKHKTQTKETNNALNESSETREDRMGPAWEIKTF